ncbi:hypothetical protein [Halorhodospira halochloris]|uniref:hypothetical protein n=1 Tax=Halorhodospira halochloris TaxID=1052 RepID=UPI001EE974A7|nr:hypothetical protein [Halorhodospira halochloris]MCG5549383.1 hypothetical protein [Halorhodospira halochloris]
MIEDTPEFQSVTEKLTGTWVAESYQTEDEDLFSSTFDRASVTYDFSTRNVEWTFQIRDELLEEKLTDWRKEFQGIDVTDYKIVITSNWRVNSDGQSILVDGDEDHELLISGSGNNFEGFYGWEMTRFEAAKAAGDIAAGGGGGLASLAAGAAASAAAKQATGTSDLFLSMTNNYTFELSNDDNNLLLCRKGSAYRLNTTDCRERMQLVRQ